jgi:hypothetical protein
MIALRKTDNTTPPFSKSFLYKEFAETLLWWTNPPFQYVFWKKSLRRQGSIVFYLKQKLDEGICW